MMDDGLGGERQRLPTKVADEDDYEDDDEDDCREERQRLPTKFDGGSLLSPALSSHEGRRGRRY